MLSARNHPFFRILFVLFFVFFSRLHAQDDSQEGFVITHENDTLYGTIRDRNTGAFVEIYEKIRFKGERKKKRFSPHDIRGYKIGNICFKSFFLDGEMTFLRVASEGHVSHYIYELQEQGEQLVQDIDYLQKGLNRPLIRVTQGLFGLKKKRLASLLSDCPGLPERILNKEFKYVFEVVALYNDCKSSQ